jgi:hypothetical protein
MGAAAQEGGGPRTISHFYQYCWECTCAHVINACTSERREPRKKSLNLTAAGSGGRTARPLLTPMEPMADLSRSSPSCTQRVWSKGVADPLRAHAHMHHIVPGCLIANAQFVKARERHCLRSLTRPTLHQSCAPLQILPAAAAPACPPQTPQPKLPARRPIARCPSGGALCS